MHGGTQEDLRAALENARGYRQKLEVAESALDAARDAQRQATEQEELALKRAADLRGVVEEERVQWEEASAATREELSKTYRRLVEVEKQLRDTEGKLESSRKLADDRLKEKRALDRQLAKLEAMRAEELRAAEEALETEQASALREREQASVLLESKQKTAAENLARML